MKKRILAILLTLCIALGMAPAAFAADEISGTCGENLTWVLDEGILTISGTGTMEIDNLVSPWNNYRSTIQTVVIESGITNIAEQAFAGCTNLTTVTIPDSVTELPIIVSGVFSGCISLTGIVVHADNPSYSSLDGVLFDKNKELLIICPVGKSGSYDIPDSVTSINSDAFSGCFSLTSVTIPKGVKSISDSLFKDCTSLTNVNIPDGVKRIGIGAFWNCTNLTNITIPNSVTNIMLSAFYGCTSLTDITIPNSVTSIGESAFMRCTNLTSATIPTGVTYISRHLFEDCTSLTNVVIPNNITSIVDFAFKGCTELASITIPDSVIRIGTSSFMGCSGLTSIDVNTNNPNYSSANGVLFDRAMTALIVCPAGKCDSYDIPDSVISINSEAFSGCSSLTNITIPASVTSIGSAAFLGCSNLTSVTIPNSVTSIGWGTFLDCTSLNSVTIPGSVTSIGSAAFSNCTNLTSITISSGVTSISTSAFMDCTRLSSVTIPSSVSEIEEMALGYIYLGDNGHGGDLFDKVGGFTIYGYSGTVAERYAKANGFTFVPLGSTTTEPEPPVSSKFTDVPADAYYADAVAWAVKNGVTTGMTETTFAPESNCTRAQAVTFLWRAAGNPEPKSMTNPFTDVADTKHTNWYYKAVLWAVEQGITTGTTATTFSPDEVCNRAQIVTFLYRHAGKPAANGGTFSDVAADQYYYQAVQWATANEITNGMGNGKFEPGTDCSRGHIVTFLYRDFVKS